MQVGPVLYSASMDAIAVTAATDLFEITPATDRAICIYGLHLGQTTDLGSGTEETLRIGIYRDVTAGSTGTALTEVVYNHFSAANTTPTAAVVTNRGTPSSGGTLIDVIPWNIHIPLYWEPIPEMRPKFSNIAAEGPVSTFRLMTAPTDSITISGTLIWAEI